MMVEGDQTRGDSAGPQIGSKFKPSAECSNKTISLGCLLERAAESDPAVQDSHRVQVGS